jgi:hypothetical protein
LGCYFGQADAPVRAQHSHALPHSKVLAVAAAHIRNDVANTKGLQEGPHFRPHCKPRQQEPYRQSHARCLRFWIWLHHVGPFSSGGDILCMLTGLDWSGCQGD